MSNQTVKKNYSYIAWIVALAAFVAAMLLGIVRGLVASGAFTVANIDKLNQAILVAAGITILALATYAILEPERVRRFLTGRQARYGSEFADQDHRLPVHPGAGQCPVCQPAF